MRQNIDITRPHRLTSDEEDAQFDAHTSVERDAYGITLNGYNQLVNAPLHVLALLGARRYLAEWKEKEAAALETLLKVKNELRKGSALYSDFSTAERNYNYAQSYVEFAGQDAGLLPLPYSLTPQTPDAITMYYVALERAALRQEYFDAQEKRELGEEYGSSLAF